MLVDFFFLLAAYEILATGFPQGCRLHVLYELVGGSAAVDDNTVAKRELRSHEAIPWKWLWWRRWWLRRLKRSVKWERMNARAACGRHGRRWNRAGRLTPPHQIVILELIIFREYCHFPFIKALCSMAYIKICWFFVAYDIECLQLWHWWCGLGQMRKKRAIGGGGANTWLWNT